MGPRSGSVPAWGVPARYREHGSSSDDDDDDAADPPRQSSTTQATENVADLGARLLAIGAEQALEPLQRECVDLAALSLMGEAELREIGVPLGPRVKILNSGLCAARRARGVGASSAAELDGGGPAPSSRPHTAWDMEVVADVEALQQAAPRMCLHVRSGRVHRMAGGILDAGILVNTDDVPFVVLMGQDEGSFFLQAQGEGLEEVAVSAAAASCSPPFLASLTSAQRTVLEQVVRRIWQASVEAAADWCESDGNHRPKRSRAPASAIQLPSHTRSSSSASSEEEEEEEKGQAAAAAAAAARSPQHGDKRGPSLSPQGLGDGSRKSGRGGPAAHVGGGGGGVPSRADTAQAAPTGDVSSATDADGDKETQASGTEGAQTLAADAVQCGHAPRQPRTAAESGFAFDGFARKERLGGQLTRQVLQQSPLIVVFDGVGSPALHRSVCETFLQPGMWGWGHTSLGAAAPSRHDAVFWKCDEDALQRSSAVRYLTSLVLNLAAHVAGKALVLQRVYANGHTFGQGGSLHVDEHGSENYAAIYYANMDWQPQWLGHTHYLPGTLRHLKKHAVQGLDMSLAVLPKAQRLAIHDGRQCHVGTPPHRSFTGLRVTLAWKFAVTEAQS